MAFLRRLSPYDPTIANAAEAIKNKNEVIEYDRFITFARLNEAIARSSFNSLTKIERLIYSINCTAITFDSLDNLGRRKWLESS